jgi:hypothetical protein
LAVGADLHLVAEAHVMIDAPARHTDVVGDLVDLVALPGARQSAGGVEPVNGRMVCVVRVDVPISVDIRDMDPDAYKKRLLE